MFCVIANDRQQWDDTFKKTRGIFDIQLFVIQLIIYNDVILKKLDN